MDKAINLCFLLTLLLLTKVHAQETFPRNDIRDKREKAYAFINAHIVDHQTDIENSVMLIRNGKIENVGTIPVPSGYEIIDLKGKYIYPSFIDVFSSYGVPLPDKITIKNRWIIKEETISTTKGAFSSNEAIKSEYEAASQFTIDKDEAKLLRALGFGTMASYRADGLARGSSVLVTLVDDSDNLAILKDKVAAHYAFDKGTSRQTYPISPMGYIALLRQTYLDAIWYNAQKTRPFIDKSLEEWILLQELPQIFDTNSWLALLRADKLGDEFGVQYIIKGSGDEYKRLSEVKRTNAPLIIPLNFPAANDVDDVLSTELISLAEMKHWELAPSNPALLEKSGINYAFTLDGLGAKSQFEPNIKKAIKRGLSKKKALEALTYYPAKLMNVEDRLSLLKNGYIANFIITDGPVFDDDSKILENWIQGNRHVIKPLENNELKEGEYNLKYGLVEKKLTVKGKAKKQQIKIAVNDTVSIKVKSKISNEYISLSFKDNLDSGDVRLSGWKAGDIWKGEGQRVNGDWITWSLAWSKETEEKSDSLKTEIKVEEKADSLGNVIFPFVAHGNVTVPISETLLIKHATVWTNEADGIVEDLDVLIENGKIKKVGKDLKYSSARIIDANGKHITPGIIDEHTHIATSAVNDYATNTSMVRIGDVLNSEDINMYYALAGGVTTAQILHGSANPIGGQSAHIKLKWGESPEYLKISNASPFIKFALGENVKRSSNPNSIRYPQTRMGVEQVFIDAFTNAKAYEKRWQSYNNLSEKLKNTTLKPRRDLVNETMLEILNKKRFITCHSYLQSEINMLMKVAERFDFRVNTFTHILEGYKVADKMNAHGVGASTFSDWWAYKWEVRYAIPYNATIMHNEGVVTAINSDDREMMRRLNQEAAKSVKYGGMDEEDALKMITLNPAKLLLLDHRIGSIKPGKDADLVIWSDHPLSIYAKAEKTIIEGTIYFDIDKEAEKETAIRKERARLIQEMKAHKEKGDDTKKTTTEKGKSFHCEDLFIESY